MEKKINVNELSNILREHLKAKWVNIKQVEVADGEHQWNPIKTTINVGGVLTIIVKYE